MMNKVQLQAFIDEEASKAEANYYKGIYSIDKAIGHLAGMSQLAAKIDDSDRLENIGRTMWLLREKDCKRLKSIDAIEMSRNWGKATKGVKDYDLK